MTISRRWFMAGLALTGAAVPAVYYGHRELTRPDPTITPGEASFDVADVAGQRRADTLRGIWTIRFTGRDAGLEGLPRTICRSSSTSARGAVAWWVTSTAPFACVAPMNRVTGCWAIWPAPTRSN